MHFLNEVKLGNVCLVHCLQCGEVIYLDFGLSLFKLSCFLFYYLITMTRIDSQGMGLWGSIGFSRHGISWSVGLNDSGLNDETEHDLGVFDLAYHQVCVLFWSLQGLLKLGVVLGCFRIFQIL